MNFEPFAIGIPVYNEEELLQLNSLKLLEYLRTLNAPFEIIIGSNGSTDQTRELGQALAREHPEIRFFHLPERGVGQVFRRFVAEARHDLLISLDMDLSIDMNFVNRALELLADHDIVVGSKKMGTQKRSLIRFAASTLFVTCAGWLLNLDYDDYSIAAKAFRRPLLRRYEYLIREGTAYVIDMIYYVQRDGGRVVQIPVFCEDHRQSKFNLIHEGYYKFYNLGRLWWERNATPRG
jgi:glycosyltransferase involved in cell wall biosynthesis